MQMHTKNRDDIDERVERAINNAICNKVAYIVEAGGAVEAAVLARMRRALAIVIKKELFYNYQISERKITKR